MTSTALHGFAIGGQRRSRLRITARGRAALAVIVLAPVVAAAIALSSAPAVASDAPRDSNPVSFSYITVESGESLWSIAERIAPKADPRDVITEISALNGLDGASVSAGQSLAVPQQYAP
ncbi:LysM peptidoglycan-binding domain-containing protein [Naasia lichenicola]|nr:LysM peptidoglycan-binding domain-containing protein [Naasia lichenicola]